MEANHMVAACHADDFNHLLAELGEIRSEMLRVEKVFENKTKLVHERHRESARKVSPLSRATATGHLFAPTIACRLRTFLSGKV